VNKLLSSLLEEDLIDENTDSELLAKQIFILISSNVLDRKNVVPLYYKRQQVEQLFGISKDDLELLPLRVTANQP
jgi:hypothetical protein